MFNFDIFYFLIGFVYSNFRFVMSSLNISGRRIVSMDEVDEMINAVDDGDGRLDYQEFIKLLTK